MGDEAKNSPLKGPAGWASGGPHVGRAAIKKKERIMAERLVKTNVLIPEKLLERGKIRAVKEKMSFTALVRKALKEYLAKPLERES
jgi:hypothetical protein